ncbi:B-box zinc finger protein 21-like [Andrographis paniculata]|uniref:B-box zinc finger protein 21-like n=1 Tax=Andrographis paniculata TaxID=175694 RepID=UPI0021E74DBB|nr:B-box zinc finger protein 21-like [Andrographis paniculata]
MKIQCDVCGRDGAAVFCVADEAALCAACDRRVHHANKLAGKHHRFTLIHSPSPKQAPVCDICQERKAFLFCQQDRAIMCRECDGAIHRANEHTRKHARFLLAGVKLSPTTSLYAAPPSSPESATSGLSNSSEPVCTVSTPSTAKGTTGESEKSFSGTFTEPGWHFDEFLDSSYIFKDGENELLPLWDSDWATNSSYTSGYFPTGKMEIWVPQQNPGGLGEQSFKEFTNNSNSRSTRKRDQDNCFAVPQTIPSPNASNRSRIL